MPLRASELSLERAIAQLIVPTLCGGPLRDRPYQAERHAQDLAQYGWGGYIVFHTPYEVLRERLSALHAVSTLPLLVASDMEHGAGQQAHGLSVFPPLMAFGATGDVALSRELGRLIALEALSIGVNWVLGPVADVTNNPLNPIINLRSFGGDPHQAARHVAAYVQGCQEAGALACAKHFPGHGDTDVDSHTALATIHASRERWEAVERPPFQAAIDAGVAALMSAHVAVPALSKGSGPSGTGGDPATLSPRVMTDLLRGEMGFEGLIITDALIMGGITGGWTPHDAAVLALVAGCDMVLMPPEPVLCLRTVLEAVRDGRLSEERIYASAERVLRAKDRIKAPAPVAPEAGRALARTVAGRALTLVRGQTPRVDEKTLVLTIDDGALPETLADWSDAVAAEGLSAGLVRLEGGQDALAALDAVVDRHEQVLVAAFSPIQINKDRSLLPARVVEWLRGVARRRPTSLISFSSPFLVAQLPEAPSALVTYGLSRDQLWAAMEVVRGRATPLGRLPVEMPAFIAAPGGELGAAPPGPSFA